MNIKFLPFIVGVTLFSVAANADDFSCDHLAVGKYNPNSTIYSLLELNMDNGIIKDYFIQADNKQLGAYTTMFQVSKAGFVSTVGWDVSGGTATNSYRCPHLSCKINPNNTRAFLFSTGGFQYKPEINFSAGGYTFDGGDMVVNGKVTCKNELNVTSLNANDVNVKLNNVADYVFDENYDLKSLSEVESYVKENKHLPGIPSAEEIEQNGVSLSKMSNMLLEKVEELTLHMIRLEKENAALKAELKSLKK